MRKNLGNIIIKILVYELLFILVFIILLSTISHEQHKPIYYLNIAIYSIISFACLENLKLSKINREILLFIGFWTSIMTILSIIFIFQENYSVIFNFYNFHALYLFSIGFRLLFTSYLFLYSINPFFKKQRLVFGAALITISVMCITYLPIYITGEFRSSYDPLFTSSYYTQIFNFSMLILLWFQYTNSKFILSDYLANILSVWTIIIGLEIFHYFSAQNELLFHYLAQYFYALLYMIIVVLLLLRIIYLQDPRNTDNERYVKNYHLLRGVIEKPRRGMFVEFYLGLHKIAVFSFLIVMSILGIYLYFFDKFNIFIRLSVLILLIAIVVSILLAIITWHRRWYEAIGIFFKKLDN